MLIITLACGIFSRIGSKRKLIWCERGIILVKSFLQGCNPTLFMREEILDRCEQVLKSLEAIQEYMSSISSSSDFLKPEGGQLHLDAITLRMQVIGENVKQIENHQPHFFWQELAYDVGYIVRFRDFVSHHYERLDHEVVYRLCAAKLPKFMQVLENYSRSQ